MIKNFKAFNEGKNSEVNVKDIVRHLEDEGLFDEYNGASEFKKGTLCLNGWVCSEFGKGIRKRVTSDHNFHDTLFPEGKQPKPNIDLDPEDPNYDHDFDEDNYDEDYYMSDEEYEQALMEDPADRFPNCLKDRNGSIFYNLEGMMKAHPKATKEFVDNKINPMIKTIEETFGIFLELKDIINYKVQTTLKIYFDIKAGTISDRNRY